ncbi:MAG: 5'-nucleotidase [SAR86 cluster bacterium]|jgi:5'-nucleotidase|nr:5'-nucleotidase [SAR86 cluster bacterium]
MLVIGITSRALFDLDSSHSIFREKGLDVYTQHQIDNENVPLKPGKAFSMVKKLLNLNSLIKGNRSVEVVLLSRNSADTGLRIFNSIEHHDLNITRAAFCGGNSPHEYAKAFGAHLFLSSEYSDCKLALESGIASARIMPSGKSESQDGILKVAFDGDAVIFSDESQEIFEKEGLLAFDQNEKSLARLSLSGGPFKPFLSQLNLIQKNFSHYECPIRIALVTARSAPSHERVIRTLRDWNIRIDECLFLGGMTKKDFLKAYQADIFFDDQLDNCELSSEEVATGQVVRLES